MRRSVWSVIVLGALVAVGCWPSAAFAALPRGLAHEPTSGQEELMLARVFQKERGVAMEQLPLYTDPSYALVQRTGGYDFIQAGANVRDFYVTVTFQNPDDMTTLNDVAIGFRYEGKDSEFRIGVQSDGAWGFAVAAGALLDQGAVSNFDSSPGASNTIELAAYGATGILAVNGVVVTQLDLSSNMDAGDVYVASSIYNMDVVAGRIVHYTDFMVYPLPL